jgi:signal transduction histidine kinase
MHNILFRRRESNMKHASAITTALIITAIIALGIMVVGVSAFTNKNIVPLQNSPNASIDNSSANTTTNTAQSSASTSSQVQQLQQQVNDLQSQLSQASQVIAQYQNLLLVLQQRGVISIDSNGNIYLPQGTLNSSH